MSLLQDTTLYPTKLYGTPSKSQKSSRKKQGLCQQSCYTKPFVTTLLGFALHPAAVFEAVEGWRDGFTKDERNEKKILEARKRVLYLKQHDVRGLFFQHVVYEEWS